MTTPPQEDFLRAKRNNDRVGIGLFVLFLVWLPTYLLLVRPEINRWLAPHIGSYPAILHLVPIFAGLVLVGWPLTRPHPPPASPAPPPSGS